MHGSSSRRWSLELLHKEPRIEVRVCVGPVINRDVKPFALMAGVPARQIGWMSKFGEWAPLPLAGAGEYRCPHTGAVYRLHGDTLTCHG